MSSGKHVRGCVCEKCISTTTHEAAGKPAGDAESDDELVGTAASTKRTSREARHGADDAYAVMHEARTAAVAAARAAAEELGEDDKYSKLLVAWIPRIERPLHAAERPCKPPAPPDQSQRGEALRTIRASAHAKVLELWRPLRQMSTRSREAGRSSRREGAADHWSPEGKVATCSEPARGVAGVRPPPHMGLLNQRPLSAIATLKPASPDHAC